LAFLPEKLSTICGDCGGGSESNSRGIFQRPATAQCGLQGCRLPALHFADAAQALPLLALRPPEVMQRFSVGRLDGIARLRTICPACPAFV